MSPVSPDDPYERKRVRVLDAEMAYIEAGEGAPIVLLHGNPVTSYLWRNVIPHLEGLGRCLAPDLMNSGASDNIPGGGCRYKDHIPYLDAWFEAVGATENAFFVLHDWGAALGFNRVSRFPEQTIGLAYMESMVRPRLWTDMPEDRVAQFKTLRGEAGLEMVMEDNFFVETMLFERGIVRDLSEAEKEVFIAKPTEDLQKRRQTHQWACEIPFEGEPARQLRHCEALQRLSARERGFAKALHQLRVRTRAGGGRARLLPRVAEPGGDHHPDAPLRAGGPPR